MASTRIKHRVGSGAALGATLPLVQQLGQMPRLTGMRSWGTWEGSGLVKGFGCRPVRDGSDAAVGRRSKASRGGNRGTRGRRRRRRDLWGLGGPLARVVRA